MLISTLRGATTTDDFSSTTNQALSGGMLSHTHAPTYTQKLLEVWQIVRVNQPFDYTFLLNNCLCLIKIRVYSHVTVKQTTVIDY